MNYLSQLFMLTVSNKQRDKSLPVQPSRTHMLLSRAPRRSISMQFDSLSVSLLSSHETGIIPTVWMDFVWLSVAYTPGINYY